MRQLILVAICAVATLQCFAQSTITELKIVKAQEAAATEKAKETVFTNPETMPKFPGGDAAMFQWIASHIKYPEAAAEEYIQGRVLVSFVVEKDGSVSSPKIVRGKHPLLDKEALRLVNSMPKFIPGTMEGKPIRCTYNLPITFRLQ